MRFAFVALLVLHGLIHVMGFLKAFGFAEMAQLTQPISRGIGLLWLVAAAMMLASAVTYVAAPQWFWLVGGVALVLSQTVIVTSWRDAKFGTIANAIVLVGVVLAFASRGPGSLWAEYRGAVSEALAHAPAVSVVGEDDLRGLPEPVQKYLRATNSVGQPRVHSFKATWKGRIRASASDAWMPFEAEQYNFDGREPSRLFFMDATMKHLPVSIFHRFVGASATFRVRLLSAFTVVDAKGPEMNRSETVTLFNDACLLAPSMLLDGSTHWESIDAHAARAHFTRGAETITAELRFDDAGQLVDFVSDDRAAASSDGRSFTLQRWTTPVRDYRSFGGRRVPACGQARWEPASGGFVYIELELLDVAFNVGLS